jgi:hypothetical protein
MAQQQLQGQRAVLQTPSIRQQTTTCRNEIMYRSLQYSQLVHLEQQQVLAGFCISQLGLLLQDCWVLGCPTQPHIDAQASARSSAGHYSD